MTQENKVAIIIGFALLLVVGILVSDHLAEVARGEPGSLAAIDPLDSWGPADQSQIESLPLVVASQPAPADTPAPSPVRTSDRRHAVASGESLSSIAMRYYGDRTLADALARYNALPNPNSIRSGVRLLVPSRDMLRTHDVGDVPQGDPAPREKDTTTYAVYTVQSGDTLSELAQHLLGSARNTDHLLELNQSVLSSPDVLQPGMELRYPSGMQSP